MVFSLGLYLLIFSNIREKKRNTPPKKSKSRKPWKLLKLMGILPKSVMPEWIQCVHSHNSLAQKVLCPCLVLSHSIALYCSHIWYKETSPSPLITKANLAYFWLLLQVQCLVDGDMPRDFSRTLVFTNQSLQYLQKRIVDLRNEKIMQREIHKKAREQHKQLLQDRREMEMEIQRE